MGTLEERKAKLTDPARREAMRHIYDRSRQPIAAGRNREFRLPQDFSR